MNTFSSPRWLAEGHDDLRPLTDISVSRTTVDAFTPTDEAQKTHRQAVLDFIDEHDDALHRSCLVGHLTASAWVIDHSGSRGLIMYHSKIQRWVQPGGHADGDANLAAVALKEATEETGIAGLEVWSEPIDVDIHLFVNRKQTEPDHLHHDLRFLVRAPVGAVEQGNEESEALRWVTGEETDDPALALDPSTIRLARSGFARAAVAI